MTIFTREMLIFKSNLRTNLIRSMIFPLIIIIFFGNLGNGVTNVPIAVANYANNPSSVQFINTLESGSTLSVQAVTNQQEGLDMLRSGTISSLVVILPAFPKPQGGSPSVYVYYATSQFAESGVAIPTIENAAAKYSNGVGSVQIESDVNAVSTQGTSSSYRAFLIAGVILMSVAFGGVFGGGMSIIVDRQLGNIKSFLITPISKNAIILGKLFSGTVQSTIYGLLALVIGLLLGGGIAMGPFGLVYIFPLIILVALAFSGIAIMLGSRIKAIEVYAIIAQTIVMPLWFLSGAFFPASSFPAFLRPFNAVDPLTYATGGIRDVMLNGYFPLDHILLDFGVVTAFAILGIIVSFRLFKSTIE
jgi:ABC-2 type transport system permease protein